MLCAENEHRDKVSKATRQPEKICNMTIRTSPPCNKRCFDCWKRRFRLLGKQRLERHRGSSLWRAHRSGASNVSWQGFSFCPGPGADPGLGPCSYLHSEDSRSTESHRQASTLTETEHIVILFLIVRCETSNNFPKTKHLTDLGTDFTVLPSMWCFMRSYLCAWELSHFLSELPPSNSQFHGGGQNDSVLYDLGNKTHWIHPQQALDNHIKNTN